MFRYSPQHLPRQQFRLSRLHVGPQPVDITHDGPQVLLTMDGRIEVGGCDAVELAREFGTPAYVVAEAKSAEAGAKPVAMAEIAMPAGSASISPGTGSDTNPRAPSPAGTRGALLREGPGCERSASSPSPESS